MPYSDPNSITQLEALCSSFLRFFENDARFSGTPIVPDERPVSPGDFVRFRLVAHAQPYDFTYLVWLDMLYAWL